MAEQSNSFSSITFPACLQLKVSIFTVNMQRPFTGNLSLPVTSVWVLHIYGKMGVLHIYGTFFYRKYATPKKFSQQNWQMWVIFCQSDSHFFWDISKLPNLKDLGKTSTKKISQRTQEWFFRNYATLFIGGRCIFTEITVHIYLCCTNIFRPFTH